MTDSEKLKRLAGLTQELYETDFFKKEITSKLLFIIKKWLDDNYVEEEDLEYIEAEELQEFIEACVANEDNMDRENDDVDYVKTFMTERAPENTSTIEKIVKDNLIKLKKEDYLIKKPTTLLLAILVHWFESTFQNTEEDPIEYIKDVYDMYGIISDLVDNYEEEGFNKKDAYYVNSFFKWKVL